MYILKENRGILQTVLRVHYLYGPFKGRKQDPKLVVCPRIVYDLPVYR